jgi:hypothetical protein
VDSYTCPACGTSGFPGFVLGLGNRLVLECTNGECRRVDASLTPQDFSKGIAAVDDTSGAPGWGGKRMVAVDAGDAAPPVRPTASPVVTGGPPRLPSPPAARAPGDVLAWIEERAAWLCAEEARIEGEIATCRATLSGVRAEKRRLEKMMKAGRAARRANDDEDTIARELAVTHAPVHQTN